MRSGITKFINKAHALGINDPEYDQWLSETKLPLDKVKTAHNYYVCCRQNGQQPDVLLAEIKYYENSDKDLRAVLACDMYGGKDVLVGMHNVKEKLIEACKANPYKGAAYEYIFRCIFPIYKKDKELCSLLLSLIDLYEDSIPEGGHIRHFQDELADVFSQVTKKKRSVHWMCLKRFLWFEFSTNRKNSLLYQAWSQGYELLLETAMVTSNQAETFAKTFIEHIKNKPGTLADNFKSYFNFGEKATGYFYSGGVGHPTYYRYCEFNYDKAYREIRGQNLGARALQKIQKAEQDYFIANTELLDRMSQVCDGSTFTVDIPCFHITFQFSAGGTFNVYMKRFEKTSSSFSSESGQYRFYPAGTPRECNFFVTPDNKIWYCYRRKNKQSSWFPLSMKALYPFFECDLVAEYFNALADVTHNLLLKDVLRDMSECKHMFVSPIRYEDTVLYHNKAEYFKASYKNASIIKWNYNKHNVNLSYMVLKALSVVSVADYGILQNTPEIMLKYIDRQISGREAASVLLTEFLAGFYTERDSSIGTTARDYVNMSRNSRKDVVLHYSIKRMVDEHDHFNDNQDYKYYSARVPSFKVRQNSKFNNLRKLLPKPFEWIKTKKRLINESIMMHHCVWSYYDRIQNDICAIYSYMDETGEFDVSKQNTPKRYTIEFVFNPRTNTYEIRQIQTAYDRYGGELLREHILSILKEKNYAES